LRQNVASKKNIKESFFKTCMQSGGDMPYIDIKIVWNRGTVAQRAELIERAARMVADVLEKEPIVESITVQKGGGDDPDMAESKSSEGPPSYVNPADTNTTEEAIINK